MKLLKNPNLKFWLSSADLVCQTEIVSFLDQVVDKFGGIDILVE